MGGDWREMEKTLEGGDLSPFRRQPTSGVQVSRDSQSSRVEAGSNTSTVTLRGIGGDEKGSLESETVNYGHESHGSRTRKCLHRQGPAVIVKDRPVL
jgi:hypothetical protein